MIWLFTIGLALAGLVLGIVAFRVPKAGWTSLAAALVLGLAGYATQASPGLPGAPASARQAPPNPAAELIDLRREFSGSRNLPVADAMIVADAMTRQAQHGTAATLLSGVVSENPEDAEAWLALGNALVEHAQGHRTDPAMLAYRRAALLAPDGLGTGYFIGLSYIRDGDFAQTRRIWAETLENGAENAPGRQSMTEQLARLDQLLAAVEASAPDHGTGPTE